ncbi:MAG: hypothetical protein GXO61_06120 [Epsilonproteobacteria bacterium]|nr:hypothetical protein [Campylobacterota bacterium]
MKKLLFLTLPLLALELPRYDPFKKSIPKRKWRYPTIKVEAIFNHKAFINGRFYSVGDRIGVGKVVKVAKDYVVISFGRRKKIFFLSTPKKVVKIK